ncbi:hypothetical protein [Archangium sp.]|uniref:hypothetical protein n=1 Tax=Archangium sp. TaxID=1872627 RepID=UPI00389A175D
MSPNPPSKPRVQPPLDVLRERARGMEAGRAEVDALLLGLSQPLRPQETVRARADVLHLIINDPWLGGFTGSDGRRVDGAAAQALVALEPSFASELSPEGNAALERAELASQGFVSYDDPPPVVLSKRQHVGQGLALMLGVLELGLVLLVGNGLPKLLLGLTFVALTSFMPVFVATSEQGIRNRGLHYVCLVLAALGSVPCLLVAGALFLFNGYINTERTLHFLLPLMPTLVQLAVPFLLYSRNPASAPQRARRSEAG